jgi:ribulose 1,5-bisphosphate synthetase/thiazole synthase
MYRIKEQVDFAWRRGDKGSHEGVLRRKGRSGGEIQLGGLNANATEVRVEKKQFLNEVQVDSSGLKKYSMDFMRRDTFFDPFFSH